MPLITRDTTLAELAATVSEALESAGIVATLSGGAAVSLYSENRYESSDLDFVTTALRDEIEQALAPLGFVHTGTPRLSVFEHLNTDWYLEFPAAALYREIGRLVPWLDRPRSPMRCRLAPRSPIRPPLTSRVR